jgi:hypothetical protein
MDLAFGDAVAPLEGEPSLNGTKIILEPTGEAGQFHDTTIGRLRHPCLQGVASTLPDKGQKGLNQLVGPCYARIQLTEVVDIDGRILGLRGTRADHLKRDRTSGRPLGARVRRALPLRWVPRVGGPSQPRDEAADGPGGVGVAERRQLTPELPTIRAALSPAADQIEDVGGQHPGGWRPL